MGQTRALTGIGNVYRNEGEHEKALESYQQALALFEQQSVLHDQEARALIDISNVRYDQRSMIFSSTVGSTAPVSKKIV